MGKLSIVLNRHVFVMLLSNILVMIITVIWAALWEGGLCQMPTAREQLDCHQSIELNDDSWGWSGGAKVKCILHHWGVQLILAYSWARPAILVVGKGRGGNVFISSVSSLSFLFLFLPCPSLSSPLLSLLSLFSLSLGDDTKWPSRVDVSLNPNTINQMMTP